MYRMIIDTETAFDRYFTDRKTGERKPIFTTGLVYDFGGVVVDDDFNEVYSFDFVIDDVFNGMPEKMATAYYADKMPQYHAEITAGVRTVISFYDAWNAYKEIVAAYNVKAVYAYNCKFDINSLNYTLGKLSNGYCNDFFGSMPVRCIMGAFKSVMANSRNYFKCAVRNGQVTDCGNVRMTAESAYQYVSKDDSFIEAHTALADSRIEAAILKACVARHRKMDTKPQTVNSGNYRAIQAKFAAYQQ